MPPTPMSTLDLLPSKDDIGGSAAATDRPQAVTAVAIGMVALADVDCDRVLILEHSDLGVTCGRCDA